MTDEKHVSDQSIAKQYQTSRCKIAICLLINIASTIALVEINKYIYINYSFPNMSLTFLNLVFTFFGLLLINQFGFYEIIYVPLIEMLPMAVYFCGFCVLANFSLQFNSVGTYQSLKVLNIPGCMIVAALLYRKTFSVKVILSVIPVILGIFLNSIYDLNYNTIGLAAGIISSISSSFYQVLINEKQKKLEMNALQLLTYQSPLSSLLVFIFIPFVDHESGFPYQNYLNQPNIECIFILISCLTAFLVNLSTFWIIGTTSPLTYNMSGTIKHVLIIVSGFILFHETMKPEQILSIFLITFGLFLYSLIKLKETEEPPTLLLMDKCSSAANLVTSSKDPNN